MFKIDQEKKQQGSLHGVTKGKPAVRPAGLLISMLIACTAFGAFAPPAVSAAFVEEEGEFGREEEPVIPRAQEVPSQETPPLPQPEDITQKEQERTAWTGKGVRKAKREKTESAETEGKKEQSSESPEADNIKEQSSESTKADSEKEQPAAGWSLPGERTVSDNGAGGRSGQDTGEALGEGEQRGLGRSNVSATVSGDTGSSRPPHETQRAGETQNIQDVQDIQESSGEMTEGTEESPAGKNFHLPMGLLLTAGFLLGVLGIFRVLTGSRMTET